jgi:TonB family protein
MSVFMASLIATREMQPGEQSQPRLASRAAGDTVGCLDTLHADDSVTSIVTMRVKPQDPKASLPADFEGLFIQEFRSRLKVPGNLPLSVMRGWKPCDSAGDTCSGGVLILGSQAYATAHQDGRLSRIAIVDFALTPTMGDRVRAALQELSDEKLVPLFTGPDSIPLAISILNQQSDTLPAYRNLFRAKLPHYSAQFRQAQWPKNAKGPKYPSIAERARVSDTVKLTFTTLPDGSVTSQSVDLQAGHYTDFARAVIEMLAKTHYVPARVGSCPVSSWQSQTFEFRLP